MWSSLFRDGDHTGIPPRRSSRSVALAPECDLSKQSDIQQKLFLFKTPRAHDSDATPMAVEEETSTY
ncbi:hypothetical protein EYF80_040628 [Liparis tanakae]|uniref:Uncharacterized protein n=1 Tax=Liparis tanakae TaxID=230148 RepID=A0A4Z2G7X3_9TELE|nr:hypothetical protein EYF80_040628 [Liparis tanakae]